jgi:hypothetical protein
MVQAVKFERPKDAPNLLPFIKYSASLGLPLVEKDCHKGERCLIVGTGPTLKNKTVFRQIKSLAKSHVVIGLKESIPYLISKGIEVTYAVSMDPGGKRQIDRTPAVPGVTYCVASSCHSDFYDHLLENKCKIEIFHSACGQGEAHYEKGILVNVGGDTHAMVEGEFVVKVMNDDHEVCPVVNLVKNEVDIYRDYFGGDQAVMCGGFTVTNRALALAKYMGFDVTMAATDFGWRKMGGSHYCDLVQVDHGDDAYMTDQGAVDGTPWYTRPDQLASAVDVAMKVRAGELEIIGDTLPSALAKRDESFLKEIVKMV